MQKISAAIITIGDELLIGQVTDTNSVWLSQELNKLGIPVNRKVSVGDHKPSIWNALEDEMKCASVIILTGGLGPTADDITKPLLCEFFGGEMQRHEPTIEHLQDLFANVLKRPFTERNQLQAYVPSSCTVLLNKSGTAPGMLFKKDEKIVISLPGVPLEMKWLFEHEVKNRLIENFTLTPVIHKTLLTAGVGESFLADMLIDFEEKLPPTIKLAYLPNFGMVRLRLSATKKEEVLISSLFEELKIIVQTYLVADEDISLQQATANLLTSRGKTLVSAESCTGGYLGHLFTALPGASKFYLGGIISYSNEVKIKQLKVDDTIIVENGAVSEEVVKQMAAHARRLLNSDYAVAVSGIMGPGGATPNKPVGMAWIAVADEKRVIAKQILGRYNRETNIHFTAIQVINMLRMLIVDNL